MLQKSGVMVTHYSEVSGDESMVHTTLTVTGLMYLIESFSLLKFAGYTHVTMWLLECLK